jgi:hypothetical protein
MELAPFEYIYKISVQKIVKNQNDLRLRAILQSAINSPNKHTVEISNKNGQRQNMMMIRLR